MPPPDPATFPCFFTTPPKLRPHGSGTKRAPSAAGSSSTGLGAWLGALPLHEQLRGLLPGMPVAVSPVTDVAEMMDSGNHLQAGLQKQWQQQGG